MPGVTLTSHPDSAQGSRITLEWGTVLALVAMPKEVGGRCTGVEKGLEQQERHAGSSYILWRRSELRGTAQQPKEMLSLFMPEAF
eukprot:1151024-Pelagomonas_calceolata.AAC.3